MAQTQPELISIHLHKTAGTSFMEILKQVYGDQQVSSLHIDHHGNGLWRAVQDDEEVPLEEIVLQRKVIHGHSSVSSLQRFVDLPKGVPIITWLRDPVERVESAYNFASQIYKNELSQSHPRLNILNSLKRNVLEYASVAPNRNWMSRMLDGIELEDLYFVGIVEHFEEDVAYLAEKLGWGNYSIPHINRSANRPVLAPHKREAIKAWNKRDVDLYEKALALRKQRT